MGGPQAPWARTAVCVAAATVEKRQAPRRLQPAPPQRPPGATARVWAERTTKHRHRLPRRQRGCRQLRGAAPRPAHAQHQREFSAANGAARTPSPTRSLPRRLDGTSEASEPKREPRPAPEVRAAPSSSIADRPPHSRCACVCAAKRSRAVDGADNKVHERRKAASYAHHPRRSAAHGACYFLQVACAHGGASCTRARRSGTGGER